MHAPYKGQEPKKGFVCVFATSCENSFRDIPKIIRVSNIIPWPNISKNCVCQQQKICPKNRANIIDPTHFGYPKKNHVYHIQLILGTKKNSCAEHPSMFF